MLGSGSNFWVTFHFAVSFIALEWLFHLSVVGSDPQDLARPSPHPRSWDIYFQASRQDMLCLLNFYAYINCCMHNLYMILHADHKKCFFMFIECLHEIFFILLGETWKEWYKWYLICFYLDMVNYEMERCILNTALEQ